MLCDNLWEQSLQQLPFSAALPELRLFFFSMQLEDLNITCGPGLCIGVAFALKNKDGPSRTANRRTELVRKNFMLLVER